MDTKQMTGRLFHPIQRQRQKRKTEVEGNQKERENARKK